MRDTSYIAGGGGGGGGSKKPGYPFCKVQVLIKRYLEMGLAMVKTLLKVPITYNPT